MRKLTNQFVIKKLDQNFVDDAYREFSSAMGYLLCLFNEIDQHLIWALTNAVIAELKIDASNTDVLTDLIKEMSGRKKLELVIGLLEVNQKSRFVKLLKCFANIRNKVAHPNECLSKKSLEFTIESEVHDLFTEEGFEAALELGAELRREISKNAPLPSLKGFFENWRDERLLKKMLAGDEN